MKLDIHMTWPVADGSYAVIEAISASRPEEWDATEQFVVPTPTRPETAVTRYAPFAEAPGLFREFADTPPTVAGIVHFASRRGLLTADRSDWLADQSQSATGRGEAVLDWQDAIVTMRFAVGAWDLLRAGDAAGLVRHFRQAQGHDGRLPDPGRVARATEVFDPSSRNYFRGDRRVAVLFQRRRTGPVPRLPDGEPAEVVLGAARASLGEILSQWLAVWSAIGAAAAPGDGRVKLQAVPVGLLGMMWLQFATAVDQDKDFRRCAGCATWLEVSPWAARSNRIYCSNACKLRSYRQRQAEARELFAQRKSVRQIAKALDSDEETVSGWVGVTPLSPSPTRGKSPKGGRRRKQTGST